MLFFITNSHQHLVASSALIPVPPCIEPRSWPCRGHRRPQWKRGTFPDAPKSSLRRLWTSERNARSDRNSRPHSRESWWLRGWVEQQRFRGEGADATRTEELGNGDKPVDGEDQQFARGRTVRRPLSDARLPGTGGFRHTTISPPTGARLQAVIGTDIHGIRTPYGSPLATHDGQGRSTMCYAAHGQIMPNLHCYGLRDLSPAASATSANRPPLMPTHQFLVSGYLSE
jgi:hypothetical protein